MKLFKAPKEGPKVLLFDIETSYAVARLWRPGKQYVQQDQVIEDPTVIAFAAKWLGSPAEEMMYMDVRDQRSYRDDRRICTVLAKLIDQADVLLTQNGKNFDEPFVRWRLAVNEITNPAFPRHMDTKQMADQLGLPSSRLSYLSDKLNKKYKKLKHEKYPGMELWVECVEKRNMDAWREMEKYNRHDVLADEEAYLKLRSYTKSGVNLSVFRDDTDGCPNCGSHKLMRKGFFFSNAGKYQRYRCLKCDHHFRSSENLLSKEQRAKLRRSA